MTARAFNRWIYREVHGLDLPRKPPRRESVLHSKPPRDYRYRAWIRSLPSAVSGETGCQACHTGPHAIGQKASDYTCIPLTPDEHRAFDRDPRGFAAAHGLDVPALVQRLYRVWMLGRKEPA